MSCSSYLTIPYKFRHLMSSQPCSSESQVCMLAQALELRSLSSHLPLLEDPGIGRNTRSRDIYK